EPQAAPPPLPVAAPGSPPAQEAAPLSGLASRGDLTHLPTPQGLRALWTWDLVLLCAGALMCFVGGATGHAGGGVLVGLGMVSLVAMTILWMVLLSKCWKSIQFGPALSEPARTTPGKAVGFLFIPLFNLYWMFQAVWGLAVDLNRFCAAHRIEAPRVNESLALATCVMALVAWAMNILSRAMPSSELLVGLGYLGLLVAVGHGFSRSAGAVLLAKFGGQVGAYQPPMGVSAGSAGPVQWGQASQARRFRAAQEETFRNHLRYLRALIDEGFFPLLRLYALQARAGQEFQYLIVITGDTPEFKRLSHSDIFLTREKEVVSTLFDGDFSLVTPDSSVANTAGKGRSIHSLSEFDNTVTLIQSGAYSLLEQHFSPQQSARLDQAEGRPPAPPAPSAPDITELKPATLDFEAVMAHLKNGDASARLMAMRAAREQRFTQGGVIHELINLLGRDHPEVSSQAALTLVALDMVAYALRSLKDEYQHPARMRKDQALAAVKLLEQTLNDPQRWAALYQQNWEKY
ncbi:MAG: hypothetical protein V1806_14875, partial [Pseudomonadota bacterium]